MNRWVGLAGVVLLAVSVASSGCGGGQEQTEQTAQQGQPGGGGRGGRGGGNQAVPVVVETAQLRNMPIDVTAIGTVEAFLTVSIRPQVTGPLLEARFKEGDFVRKGQVLFTIDPRPYDADLARARAALARDKAVAENNRSQADRYRKLLAEGVAPQQQVDQFLSAAEAADATVVADEAAIRQAQLNLDYCTIAAPIDGYTGKLLVQPGNLIRAADALVVINQISPIYVTFAVPQQHLGDVKKYMTGGKLSVTASLPNDTTAAERGTLEFVDNAVDPTTGTIRLRAQFDNQSRRLWPGLFVNTSLRLSNRPNTLVIPNQAISTNQDGQFVYVVKPDKTVESRPVVSAVSQEGLSIVQQGLTAGEIVVVDGQLRLVPGSRVDISNRGNGAEDTPTPPGGRAGAAGATGGTGETGRGQGRGAGQGQ